MYTFVIILIENLQFSHKIFSKFSRKVVQKFLLNYKYAFVWGSGAEPSDAGEFIKILIENQWKPAIFENFNGNFATLS